MFNILNLPDWRVLEVIEAPHDYHITADYLVQPIACVHCASDQFYKFGTMKQVFMDLPHHGKRTGITIDRQRFKCKACGRTFSEPLPDMDEQRTATKRLITYIERESLTKTFLSVAEDVGLHEKTIRNIFHEYVERLGDSVKFVTPRWLGIDEVYLVRKMRCVLTNVEENTVVEMLEKRDKRTLANYFQRVSDREKVELVTIDMWRPYLDVAQAMMPQAIVIIDKFHVVKMANGALETVRKATREGLTDRQRRTLKKDRYILLRPRSELDAKDTLLLETWTKNFTLLGQAYELKESFFEIYDAGSKTEAAKRFDAWRASVPDELETAFGPLIAAWSNWEEHILNYFDSPITNAYTEALNGVIKLVNRKGRGYSFDVIRAKILYGEGPYKVKRDKFLKRQRKQATQIQIDPSAMEHLLGVEPGQLSFNFGVELPATLKRDCEKYIRVGITTPKSE
jgi:transposase